MRMSATEILARNIAMKRMLRKTKGMDRSLVIERLWNKRFRREMLTIMGWLYRREFDRRGREDEEQRLRDDRARNLYDEGRGETWDE